MGRSFDTKDKLHKQSFMLHYRHYSSHLPNRRHTAKHFWALSVLSVVTVFAIALLSRAELRLSGDLLAAGNGSDLAILSELHALDKVTLLREEEGLKLYLLEGETQDYLATSELNKEGEWEIVKVEQLRE